MVWNGTPLGVQTQSNCNAMGDVVGTIIGNTYLLPPKPILTPTTPNPRIARPFCSRSFGPQFVRSRALCWISASRSRLSRSRCLLIKAANWSVVAMREPRCTKAKGSDEGGKGVADGR